MARQPENERIAVERKRTGSSGWVWILGAIALAAIALFLLIPLFNNSDSAGMDTGATISEIAAAPNTYVGKTVTVSGEVADVVGSQQRAFTIGGDEFFGGNELLVVSAQALPTVGERTADNALLANDVAQVHGTVQMFNLAQVEKDAGLDLDDAAFAAYAGQPVIVAQSVNVDPRAARIPMPIIADSNVTIADIASNPANFAGKNVLVRGDINSLVGPHSFTIDESSYFTGGIDNDLLVISADRNVPINEGFGEANVQVQGVVRQFNLADIENEIGYDLDDALYTDWNARPVLVANSIQAAQGRLMPPDVSLLPGAVAMDDNAATVEGSLTVAEIVSNPSQFIGQNVVVIEEVESVYGPNAFRLDEDALLAGGIDNDLLVIRGMENIPVFAETMNGETIQVQGVVRQFDMQAFEQELGYDLDDNLFAEWAGRPAIIAQQVTQLEPVTPDANSELTGDLRNVTVAEITGNASQFIGQNVALTEEVESVQGPNAFTLDEDALLAGGIDNDLLVIRGMGNIPVFVDTLNGETMEVQGVVRQFNLADVENEIGYDLDDNLFTDWAGRPVIIAKSIRAAE